MNINFRTAELMSFLNNLASRTAVGVKPVSIVDDNHFAGVVYDDSKLLEKSEHMKYYPLVCHFYIDSQCHGTEVVSTWTDIFKEHDLDVRVGIA